MNLGDDVMYTILVTIYHDANIKHDIIMINSMTGITMLFNMRALAQQHTVLHLMTSHSLGSLESWQTAQLQSMSI